MEFALALPAMLALVLWIMSMGFMLYSQGVVTSAARETARYVAIYGVDGADEVIQKNLNLVVPGPVSHESEIEYQDGVVQVKVLCSYTPFVDFNAISRLLGGTRESSSKLKSVAYFKNERPGL